LSDVGVVSVNSKNVVPINADGFGTHSCRGRIWPTRLSQLGSPLAVISDLEADAHAKYEIDCPRCADVFEVDHDPAGEDTTYDQCDATIQITEAL